MPDTGLPIFVTATMAKVPKSWTPCGAVVKMDNGERAWLLVAPLGRMPELVLLATTGV
jgi:hypothetical protein